MNEHPNYDPDNPHRGQCLVCEREIVLDSDTSNVIDAGFLKAEFHYGSCHDMGLGLPGRGHVPDDGTKVEKITEKRKTPIQSSNTYIRNLERW